MTQTTTNDRDYRLCQSTADLSRKSKVFCLLPWVHMHILPDSRVVPCCLASFDHPLGFLRDSSLLAVWNGAQMRTMRRHMLAGRPCRQCSRCYEHEQAGGFSLRTSMNKKFAHHYPLVDQTDSTGALPTLSMYYWDVRFRNVCNFRCRTCDSYLSSAWYDDETALNGSKPALPRRLNLTEYTNEVMPFLEAAAPRVEEVYFAGGEPLLTPEHYELLQILLRCGRARHVRLIYNTNLSTLAFKHCRVTDLWPQFEHVEVQASLDGYGERAECLRKGQRWEQAEINLRKIRTSCPHVALAIAPTVSILNVRHLPAFHRYMLERGLIKINDWHLNILTFPIEYRVQVLPPSAKGQARFDLERHIDYLRQSGAAPELQEEYRQVVRFMEQDDLSPLLPDFLRRNQMLDALRGEDFIAIFPECSDLYSG